MLNIEGQTATLYNGLSPAQTSHCFISRTQFKLWPLSFSYCYGSGRRCKAATNCLKFPKIMPPKSLDGDSARVPKVSRASDGKGPFNQYWQKAKVNQKKFLPSLWDDHLLRMRCWSNKKSKRYFYDGKSYRKAFQCILLRMHWKKIQLLWAHFFVACGHSSRGEKRRPEIPLCPQANFFADPANTRWPWKI